MRKEEKPRGRGGGGGGLWGAAARGPSTVITATAVDPILRVGESTNSNQRELETIVRGIGSEEARSEGNRKERS